MRSPLNTRCPCGAAAHPSKSECIKCRARASWRRRKSRHDGI